MLPAFSLLSLTSDCEYWTRWDCMGRERTGREYGTRRDWHWSAVLPLNYFPSLRTLQIDYKNPLCICDYKLLHLCSEHCRELFRFISFFSICRRSRHCILCSSTRTTIRICRVHSIYHRLQNKILRSCAVCGPMQSTRFVAFLFFANLLRSYNSD